MTVTVPRKRLSLTASAAEFLLEELEAIGRTSPHAHRRRSGRAAVTFRPCRQGRDAIPAGLIPFDAFRLLAVTYGYAKDGGHGPQPRVSLGIFRPTLDLAGSGRIRFRCEQSYDLMAARTLRRPRPNFTGIRSGVVLHQAVEDADRAEFVSDLRWPRFYYGFEADRTPDFDPAGFPGGESAMVSIEGLRAWPAEWLAREDRRLLEQWRPARVFASLAHLKGRVVRNPAFGVLKRHGVLGRRLGYREWLTSVSRLEGAVRVFQDPGDERSEAGGLRRAIEDYATGKAAGEASLLESMEAGCEAMGVRAGEGEARADGLAELLDNPWRQAEVGYAAGVQLLQSSGSPEVSSMSFTDGVSEIDLSELMPRARRPCPAGH